MADEEIIRRRLLIDGDGTGDARMMTKFTKSLIKWTFTEDSPQEIQLQYERLLANLASIEQSSVKWDNILTMNSLQLEHYSTLRKETHAAVDDAQGALSEAKEELKRARQVRNHGLQYHALAKLIQDHPPRSPTADKLSKLSDSLAHLKTSRDSLDEQLVMRKKQLHVLFTALYELQSSLDTPLEEAIEEEAQKPLVDLTEEAAAMDCT